ncbi:TetR/AcrR family transcriptional regulator [Amycolatopsis cynarae]|uniref:TetR/AcrR family transcriptional regulator n=1 Tax=Amycolatopsis cynarae TaxID=2995223 RepID=A0ABY7B554_9PSEU|nr:TetR/AcrR family transcriptional regulator [Amycolatopsis sp. HUAS 11-8]WAL67077.1 TetR/AcrR family transcriptional regulator [Amycolatopsis sp. HUAS 11-8]
MATASEPRWRRLEPDERKEQIFACAARLFGERPYPDVSTSDIAASAGVARGLINHYFGTKRELYLEVIRRAITMPMPEVGGLGDGPMPERAHRLIDWFLEMVVNQGKVWLVATSDGMSSDRDVEQIIVEAERTSADRILDVLEIPAEHPARPTLNALVRSYAGMVKAAGREWLLRQGLERPQVHTLLYQSFLTLIEEVFPAVVDAKIAT